MKKIVFILFSIILTGAFFQSCNNRSDTDIQRDAQNKISANYPGVSVSIHDGVATLTGNVESEDARTQAELDVKDVNSVKSVVNNIQVERPAPTGVIINPDQTLSSTITSRLATEGFNGVNVEIEDGEVILTGDVNRSDLTRIMEIANESNPRRVVNRLNLR